MRKDDIYSTKNVFLLVSVFVIIFWLLYSLASFWHKSSKIRQEIAEIQRTNQENLTQIEEKKKYLEYLKTPQRIDKEAKMQMGKKQPNENVLIFIEEKLNILPATSSGVVEKKTENFMEDVSILDRWKWVFLRER